MKKMLIGVAIVAVLAIGGVVYFASNLDSLIKTAVEKFGSEATKTKVTLSSVDLSLQSGAAALNGFRMGNPAGFKTDKAMSFGTVSIKIDPASLTSEIIVIKEVVISGPDITYESGDGGSNFDVIQKNVDAYAKSLGAGGGDKKEAEEEGGKKIIIEHLYVRDGKVALNSPLLLGKTVSVPLPDIHLKDIGKKEKGATPAQVAGKLMDEISGSIAGAGKAGVASAAKMAKDAMDGAKKMLEGAGSGAGNAVDDATKSIKGLFGK
ncbi:MAG: hypothetical protein ACI9MJ_002393 [Alphaproteobacteria bacterium]|jgi:uncharacterized protein involved in outer membrane biogenesis